MIAYGYIKETGMYSGINICQLDPIESKIKGEAIYLLPADSTFIAPPDYNEETEVPIWSGTSWIIDEKSIPEKEETTENKIEIGVFEREAQAIINNI